MATNSILTPGDVHHLTERGLAGPGSLPGTMRVHKRRLTNRADEDNHDIPLDAPMDSDTAFAEIPDHLISYETILHVGFSPIMADQIWTEWINWPATGPGREVDPDDGGLQITFSEFLTGRVDGTGDAWSENDDEWRACLHAYGIDSDTQDAIMDPRFKDIRLTETCKYWMHDTIAMRFAGLEEIQRASRERELKNNLTAAFSHDEGNGHNGHGGEDGPNDRPSELSGQRFLGHRRVRSMSGLQQESTPGISSSTSTSQTAVASRNAPGHTTLFKAVDQARIHGLLDNDGNLDAIQILASSPPGDFSGKQIKYYFTPDYKVAEYYAAYAKRRSQVESIIMVSISIPNSAIETLESPDILRVYWPDPEWKQLIWHSRTNRKLPSSLRKYRNALLVIGTISKKPTVVYQGMDSWEQITDRCVLMVPDRPSSPAVQFVFSDEDESRDFLEQHISDLALYPFTSWEFVNWMMENGDE